MPEKLKGDLTNVTKLVMSVPLELKFLYRVFDKTPGTFTTTEIVHEQGSSRPSMQLDPMALLPCIEGRSATGEYCHKHMLNRAGVKYTDGMKMQRSFMWSMNINTQLRVMQNHVRLCSNVNQIFGIKGA
jgi:hypothetical protein